MQISLVNFPTSIEGFLNKSSDRQCMKKLNGGEFTCEMYLDFVDDLRNDEECCLLDEMNVFKVDLDVVELQPITLAPQSICQVSENQMRR